MLITQGLLRDGLGRLAAAGGSLDVASRERQSHTVVGPQPGGVGLGLRRDVGSLTESETGQRYRAAVWWPSESNKLGLLPINRTRTRRLSMRGTVRRVRVH